MEHLSNDPGDRPSSQSLYKSMAQAFSVCSIRLSVLNINNEFSLEIQTAINILDHFHSSLCRKQLKSTWQYTKSNIFFKNVLKINEIARL